MPAASALIDGRARALHSWIVTFVSSRCLLFPRLCHLVGATLELHVTLSTSMPMTGVHFYHRVPIVSVLPFRCIAPAFSVRLSTARRQVHRSRYRQDCYVKVACPFTSRLGLRLLAVGISFLVASLFFVFVPRSCTLQLPHVDSARCSQSPASDWCPSFFSTKPSLPGLPQFVLPPRGL